MMYKPLVLLLTFASAHHGDSENDNVALELNEELYAVKQLEREFDVTFPPKPKFELDKYNLLRQTRKEIRNTTML